MSVKVKPGMIFKRIGTKEPLYLKITTVDYTFAKRMNLKGNRPRIYGSRSNNIKRFPRPHFGTEKYNIEANFLDESFDQRCWKYIKG